MICSAMNPCDPIRLWSQSALLGGTKARPGGWPRWPLWEPGTDEPRLTEVLRGGAWSRADVVAAFERRWAETMGAKSGLAVVIARNERDGHANVDRARSHQE